MAQRQQDAAPATAPLTGRIARGDGAAFAAFYDAWFDRVYAMARRCARRDEAFCLDVVQDVMLKVSQGMPELEREDSVGAWLARTTWGATVDRLRADQRRARREQEAHARRDGTGDDDPATAAHARETLAWLRQQIAGLPSPERELVLARFGDGGTLAEVGQRFGMSGSAAWGRIRRTLERLRHAAREWFGD